MEILISKRLNKIIMHILVVMDDINKNYYQIYDYSRKHREQLRKCLLFVVNNNLLVLNMYSCPLDPPKGYKANIYTYTAEFQGQAKPRCLK